MVNIAFNCLIILLLPQKNCIVYHAGSCSSGPVYQAKESEAETAPGPLRPGPVFGFGSEQKQSTGDVPVLVLTHRAMAGARDAQVQRCKGTQPTKIKCKLASPRSFLKEAMATKPSHGREHLSKYWTPVKDSGTQSSFTFSFPAKSSQNFLEPDRLSQLEHIQYSEVLNTLPS